LQPSYFSGCFPGTLFLRYSPVTHTSLYRNFLFQAAVPMEKYFATSEQNYLAEAASDVK
jgi:hypothetical protein